MSSNWNRTATLALPECSPRDLFLLLDCPRECRSTPIPAGRSLPELLPRRSRRGQGIISWRLRLIEVYRAGPHAARRGWMRDDRSRAPILRVVRVLRPVEHLQSSLTMRLQPFRWCSPPFHFRDVTHNLSDKRGIRGCRRLSAQGRRRRVSRWAVLNFLSPEEAFRATRRCCRPTRPRPEQLG